MHPIDIAQDTVDRFLYVRVEMYRVDNRNIGIHLCKGTQCQAKLFQTFSKTLSSVPGHQDQALIAETCTQFFWQNWWLMLYHISHPVECIYHSIASYVDSLAGDAFSQQS